MLKVETWPVTRLIPYARNPRKNDSVVDKMAASIKEFGFKIPIIAKSDGAVIDGHLRLKAALHLGLTEVPVALADDLTDAQIKAFRLLANRSANWAEWDAELLSLELRDLEEFGFDLDLTGFDAEELTKYLGDDAAEGLTDDDAVPETPTEPLTRLGDIYVLGNHRLLCGDSAILANVEKVLDGELADMVFTDPPWNVNYGDVEKGNRQGYRPRKIMNDCMDADAWEKFCLDISGSLFAATKAGAAIYVVMSAQEWPVIDKALRNCNFHWSSTIVWAKDQLVLSRKDYHTQYEPIWYGWNNKAPRLYPVGDRKQSDLWQIARPKVSELHPTMKPVELVERAIRNSSKSRDTILDCFGGSGTTLIACEKLGRSCRMIELDPKFCDVIVKRWESYTGLTAMLESLGPANALMAESMRSTA
jgi:DNA modification methylase